MHMQSKQGRYINMYIIYTKLICKSPCNFNYQWAIIELPLDYQWVIFELSLNHHGCIIE